MTWKTCNFDFLILLAREGVSIRDIAAVFSATPDSIRGFLRLRKSRIKELRKMPPVPQEDRYQIIQSFCESESNLQNVRSMLDGHDIRFEDFVAQPFLCLIQPPPVSPAPRVYNVEEYVAQFLSERDKEIAELRRQGKTLSSIGECYGISRERVRQIIRRYNGMSDNPVPKPTRRIQRPKTSERREKLVELCQRDCLTYQQIGDALGITKEYAAVLIYEYNRTAEQPLKVCVKGYHGLSDEVRRGIVRERRKGTSIRKLSKRFGVSELAVLKVLGKEG